MKAKVGIFPGTFDPVHTGHVAFCAEALKLGLERIILLPERLPRDKPAVTEFRHRVAMLELATAPHTQLEVTTLPHERFTVAQTLPEIRRRFGVNVALLLGSDVAKTVGHWENIGELLKEMPLIIGLRRSDTRANVHASLRQVGQDVRYTCIISPELFMASKTIRQLGHPGALHPDVQAYAAKHALYRPSFV